MSRAATIPFALVFLLSACGGDPVIQKVQTDGPDAQGYRWVKDGPVGAPVFHRGVDVYLNCAEEEKALSCAIQRGDGLCDIYLPEEPFAWQEPHELRHCAGWRHPDWTHGQTLDGAF